MSKYAKDLLERCTWTFVQAFLGAFVISGGTKAAQSAAIAALAAVLAVVKGEAARRIGDRDSASTVRSI